MSRLAGHTPANKLSCVSVHKGASLGAQMVKQSFCSAGDPGSIPGQEDPLEEGMATHYSIRAWRILMDRGAWWATVHGVANSEHVTELT